MLRPHTGLRFWAELPILAVSACRDCNLCFRKHQRSLQFCSDQGFPNAGFHTDVLIRYSIITPQNQQKLKKFEVKQTYHFINYCPYYTYINIHNDQGWWNDENIPMHFKRIFRKRSRFQLYSYIETILNTLHIKCIYKWNYYCLIIIILSSTSVNDAETTKQCAKERLNKKSAVDFAPFWQCHAMLGFRTSQIKKKKC